MKKFFLFFFLLLFCFFLFHPAALARTLEFSPNVSLGPFKVGTSQHVSGDFSLLKKYIIAVYKFIIGLSAILAVIVIAIGGIIWATAAGSAGQVSKAKGLITGSLFGLVLTLLSYSLLSAVNSDITNLDFQGAMVKKIEGKAVEGCKWQTSPCNLSIQVDHTSEGAMYCSANGNKTGDEYCCCKVAGACVGVGMDGNQKGVYEVCIDNIGKNVCKRAFCGDKKQSYYYAVENHLSPLFFIGEKCSDIEKKHSIAYINPDDYRTLGFCKSNGSIYSTLANISPFINGQKMFSSKKNKLQNCLPSGEHCNKDSQCCSNNCHLRIYFYTSYLIIPRMGYFHTCE